MYNRWYLPSHKHLLVQQDKSRIMWLSKTTLANESMDRSWTAVTLTVESPRSPMLGWGFWLCIYWYLLWPKGEKLSLWKETRSHVCRSHLRWYRNLMQRTNGRPLTVCGCSQEYLNVLINSDLQVARHLKYSYVYRKCCPPQTKMKPGGVQRTPAKALLLIDSLVGNSWLTFSSYGLEESTWHSLRGHRFLKGLFIKTLQRYKPVWKPLGDTNSFGWSPRETHHTEISKRTYGSEDYTIGKDGGFT